MGWFEEVGEHATNVTLWRIHIREHASYDGACDGGEVAVKGQEGSCGAWMNTRRVTQI